MIRTVGIIVIAAGCALGGWIGHGWGIPRATSTAAALPSVAVSPAMAARDRRERMARIVAETAAATADKTAKAVLARRAAPEETAAR